MMVQDFCTVLCVHVRSLQCSYPILTLVVSGLVFLSMYKGSDMVKNRGSHQCEHMQLEENNPLGALLS